MSDAQLPDALLAQALRLQVENSASGTDFGTIAEKAGMLAAACVAVYRETLDNYEAALAEEGDE